MTRLYRALLHLYPASFRREYGDELTAVFAQRTAERGSFVALAESVADVVPSAIAAHTDILRQDLRYTARAMRRAPGFVATAVLVVALGVGANTAAFTLADFVLLRPLPFPEPDRLVKIWETTPGYSRMEASPANYRDWKTLTTSFSGMAAYSDYAANLVTTTDAPRRITTAIVTFDLMPLLGVNAALGRTIAPADSFGEPVIVLSHALWRGQFAGDPGILGRRVRLDGVTSVVIGVMPEIFHFPTRDIEAWTPLVLAAPNFQDRADNWLQVLARLRPAVSIERGAADVALTMTQLVRKYPKELENTGVATIRLREETSARSRVMVLALCGAALCILLLACANLASLLLARAINRERELAVRAALGAGRERIVRQLVTESIALALLGGLAGLLVAKTALPALSFLVPESLPIGEQPSIDPRVLAFAALIIGVTGLAFGVVPAVRAGGAKTFDGLREGARAGGARKQRLRATLVAVEIAMSVALLASSGLLVRAVWRVQSIAPGFRTDGVLAVRTALPLTRYGVTQTRVDFYTRVLGEVRTLPGVTSAAYTSDAPMTRGGGIWPVGVSGEAVIRDDANTASLRFVTPQFFKTLDIPLRRGRDVEETDDRTHANVAVVSESFAKRFWPKEEPIGKRFNFAFAERTVVGIAGDIRVRGLERSSEPQAYLPYRQVDDSSLIGYTPKDLLIRTSAPAATLLPAIRRIVRVADPEQPLSDVRTMADIVTAQTASRVAQLDVLGVLALVALLLAGVGIHGLLSFTVASRSQQIGVRLALGARSEMILAMILREGLRLALVGIVPGVLVAYAGGRAMESLLAGVKPGDAPTMLAAVGLCVVMVVVGCVRPALRASRTDPIAALRSE